MEPADFAMTTSTASDGTSGRFGFTETAEKAFSFLLRLGFACVRREATLVRFESRNVFVNVYHGHLSHQVGLEIGRVQNGDLYSLHEVLSAAAPGEVELARYQTAEPEALERSLQAIADSLDRNCHALLSGDQSAFQLMQTAVVSLRDATTRQAQFGSTIERADRAWELKNLDVATDLYSQAEAALDEGRRRRLAFLRSRMGRPPNRKP